MRTVFSIFAGSRRTRSPWRAIRSISARIWSGAALAFNMSAYWATMRRSTFFRVRPLDGLGEADGVGHRVVPAVECGARLGQHAPDDLEGLLEGLQPAGHGLEVDAEVAVLALERARTQAQVETAAAHVVHGRRH